MGWRSSLLNLAFNNYNIFTKDQLKDFDIYQFGVLDGDSMYEISGILSGNRIPFNTFYGFDVFSGMPKETEEPIFDPSWDPDIQPDAFNSVIRMNMKSPDECASHIQKNVQSSFTDSNVSVVAGLVQDTLPKQKNLKKAFYVDFDFDIYSPTKFAFNYLMENNLIVEGTFIGYDDWGGTPDSDTFKYGESRAHKEICDKWGLKIQKLYEIGVGYPSGIQNLWIVKGVIK